MAYNDLTNIWEYAKPVFRAKLSQLAQNDLYLKNNGWPTGTRMSFYQSSTPTGWTVVGTAHGRYLRVVDGVNGIGGAIGGFIPPNTSSNPTHSHIASSEPNHTHLSMDHIHRFKPLTGTPTLSGQDGFVLDANGLLQEGDSPTDTAPGYVKSYFPYPSSQSPSVAAGSHQHAVNSGSYSSFVFNYTNVLMAEKLTSSGYTDLTNYFFYGQKIIDTMFSTLLWDNDQFNLNRLTPNGTISVCSNPVAPTGWQKLNIHNDRYLVNNTPFFVTGGTHSPQSGYNFNHSHTMTPLGAHSHPVNTHIHSLASFGGNNTFINKVLVNPTGTDLEVYTTGSNTMNRIKPETGTTQGTFDAVTAHTHVMTTYVANANFKYLDVITIQKIPASPPWAFVDYRASLAFKKLVTRQKLNTLGQSDDFIKYHTTPTGTRMFFYQATAPLNWTQSLLHHDRILRVVTGSGGGVGGSQGVGSGLSFVHTHTLQSVSHGHVSSDHKHIIAMQASNTVGTATGRYAYARDGTLGNDGLWSAVPGGFSFYHKVGTVVGEDVTFLNLSDTYTHNHTMSSDGQIINFAYVNMIMCDKN